MLTRIILNDTQIAHGNSLTEALLAAVEAGHKFSPRTVARFYNYATYAKDCYGSWRIEQEPALTAETVREVCKTGETLGAVKCRMEAV